MGDYVTEQKVAKLEEMVSKLSNKNPVFTNRFEMVVAFMVVVLVVMGMMVMFK